MGNVRTSWPGNFDTGQPQATGQGAIFLEASWIGEWEKSLNLSHLSENTLIRQSRSYRDIKNRRVSVARQAKEDRREETGE